MIATRIPLVLVIASIAGCAHSPDRLIEPFGKNTYRVDDGDGVHYANRFCTAKGEVMQPLVQGTAWLDRDVLVFECVPPAAARVPNVHMEDGHVTLNDQQNSGVAGGASTGALVTTP